MKNLGNIDFNKFVVTHRAACEKKVINAACGNAGFAAAFARAADWISATAWTSYERKTWGRGSR